ncbi:family 78 glycoside hydrolase catalytic domain [Paenibacillus sp. LHD-117]|uniref:family 78 glycoside hydrolase catalytic domain n=1 Tax=Paenibacillus sp. LHD-117 TaxID=3071412 RepID=UPI0027E1F6A0|nr:family 78 glycoside hydrolase catalytic domain [Paenibacillus sp. LHD-117]MDQ6417946.1 family 78 glycoside hydrolase catalytic domain [Paenibacillus sp. LHD-117]
MSILKIQSLTCEYHTRLIGSDVAAPRFSWILETGNRRAVTQVAYRMQLTTQEGNYSAPIWDTGRVESDQSIHCEYGGPVLVPRQMYRFRVKAWDNEGNETPWSEEGEFELGLQLSDWKSEWITPNDAAIPADAEAAFLLRKGFNLRSDIVSGRVYVTAAGIYELYLNGNKVSEDLFEPGWTSYHHRMQFQTYDVTSYLRNGDNGIGVMLADGWYRGGLGFSGRNYHYGDRRAALVQLHVRYSDGTENVITSDTTWKAATGPVLYSNIYHGEVYDARLERTGWSDPLFDDSSWAAVQTVDLGFNQLVAQENWSNVVTEVISPVETIVTPAGDHVLDFGQNMVGRVRFRVNAPAGTVITLQHSEVLDCDGNIYFGNLRSAKQAVTYVTHGGMEEYAPHFTFMGFRYVKVTGYPLQDNQLPIEAFDGEVIHSDMMETGYFECSDERLNQLQRNIKWGQRGNFLDLPTDCPQRDERLGWTGDAQVFISTALFNYQGAPFFMKWLRDLKAEQHEDGGVPYVIPDIVGGASSAAWGDAAVICPWTVYQYYGDLRLLEEQFESMKKWVEYIRAQGKNEYMWNTGFHFGDWLALDAKENSYIGSTPTSLIATAYFAYSTRIVRDAALVLGRSEEADRYEGLYQNVRQSFQDEFVTKTGRVASPTQTAHVLALVFDLVDEHVKKRVAADLNDMIVENDYHLSTGFVGTPYLCFALSNHGYHTTAVRLLMQESYPGWLYSVSKGATTIWEHWDSIKPDGSFWSDDMNSFNHYSYGAVGDWMYKKVAGLDFSTTVPGFKRTRIAPLFGSTKLTFAKASYLSMYGQVESSWRIIGDRIELEAIIPANTSAEIVLMGAKAGDIVENGITLDQTKGILSITENDDHVLIMVGSGEYRFQYSAAELFREVYDVNTKLVEILMDEKATAVIREHAPNLLEGTLVNLAKPLSLEQISNNTMMRVSSQKLERIVEELAVL